MRLALATALLMASAATPAAAQSTLAQQCASFGEAHYRRLDPSVDRIVASDFPAPSMERVDARVGVQPVAAALTIRGRLTYRNRPAIETQFVCLLDASNQPLFFHAVPTLAARAAPTPVVRGGTTSPPPSTALAPSPRPTVVAAPPSTPREPLPASAMRLRGLVRDLAGRLQFAPCDGAPLALEDRTPGQELVRALRELTAGQDGRGMFVEFYGQREPGPRVGVIALEVRRAAIETAGCRERYDHREWVATGTEPVWRLEITARDMVLYLPGTAAPLRTPHGGLQGRGGTIAYAASGGADLQVNIDEQRCIDQASGALFAYRVQVASEGRTLAGCAAHNPAMPAP